MKKHIKLNNFCVYLLFFSLFITGLITFKDYGIGIDDKFHRLNGFYWLDYLLSFTNFDNIKNLVNSKLISISDHTLPSIEVFNKYSVIFDITAAVLELVLKLDNVKQFYEARHFLNFIFYFIGCIYFYKLLKIRFNKLISFFGCLIFILSPRIYGESFYNMKDIIFLTFLVIGYYYSFKCFLSFKIKNLLILSFISAICIQTRIIGLALPLSFFSFFLLSILSKPTELKYTNKIIFFFISTFLFLILIWPYLWSSPLKNFFSLFQNWVPNIYILFNGNYINNDYLPYIYVPLWILITTPTFYIILFILGFYLVFKRFYIRLINFEKNKISYDLWRGTKEKLDIYISLNFLILIMLVILLNVRLFNAWKHLYFINFYIIYFVTYALNTISFYCKKKNYFKVFIYVIIFFLSFIIFQMYKYHPYQGLYFNSLVSDNYKNKFEIDFTALSAKNFFDKILNFYNPKTKIYVAAASWTPLQRTLDIYPEEQKNLIVLVGQNYQKADYIFSNNISEVDKRTNDKYDIPDNFHKIYDFKIDGAILYTIYKKN